MIDNAVEQAGSELKQRAVSARKSLMLRSAKIKCQTGEYICLVRDVSEVGTSLSFLHDVPPEPRVILSLPNGLTYPIERLWKAKRQAGYRFGGSVSLVEFLHERHPFAARPVRLSIRAIARITDGNKGLSAQLRDISSHGAKFECDAILRENCLVGCQTSGMQQQLGQIAWSDTGHDVPRYGVRFQHPLSLQELANIALKLQPFDIPTPSGFGESLRKARAA